MAILNIKDLEFKWKGQQETLLKIDNLSLCKGERFFLRGASGIGKRSLFGLFGGINAPHA